MSQIQINQTLAESVGMNTSDNDANKSSNSNFTHKINNITGKLVFRPNLNLSSNLSAGPGSTSQAASLSSKVHGDFNGDGKDDLAIGVPFEGVGSVPYAGGVEVIYGDKSGLDPRIGDQFITQGSLTGDVGFNGYDDEFGRSLAAGDFNGDGRDDLAIGVPLDRIGQIRPGAVYVVYGTALGLGGDEEPRVPLQIFLQGSNGIENTQGNYDSFGFSLTSGDFNGDGKDDLAIGVPYENLDSISRGGVEVIYGSSSGLSATSPRADQFWTHDSTDVDAEASNYFGFSLTSGDYNSDGKDDLAIGIPGPNEFPLAYSGAVEIIYGSSSGLSATSPRADQFWTQDSPDIEDNVEVGDAFGATLASGDFNGDGKDDLAIGVPYESVGSIIAGGVEVIYGSSSGLSATSPRADQFWTQDSPNVNDRAEESDQFGASLTSGDFNGDGKDDLAIASTNEDLGSIVNAGAVEVIYGSSSGLSATSPRADEFFNQDSSGVDDTAERDDYFGSSLASGDFNNDGKDDLAIGVQGESIGSIQYAGAVQVISGSSAGLSTSSPLTDQFWTQNSESVKDSSEPNDSFGHSLG